MDCKQVEELLNEYLDGQLDDARKNMVEAHARACADCRGLIDDCKNNLTLIGKISAKKVPASLDKRMYAAIEQSSRPPLFARLVLSPVFRFGLPIAAALLIVVGIRLERNPAVSKPGAETASLPTLSVAQTAASVQAPAPAPAPAPAQQSPAAGMNTALIAREVRTVEYVLASIEDRGGTYYLGSAGAKLGQDGRDTLDAGITAAQLHVLNIDAHVKQILYRRAVRKRTVQLLQKRNIIVCDDHFMLKAVNPAYGLTKGDAILIEEENDDRQNLIARYAQSVKAQKQYEKYELQKLKDVIAEALQVMP